MGVSGSVAVGVMVLVWLCEYGSVSVVVRVCCYVCGGGVCVCVSVCVCVCVWRYVCGGVGELVWVWCYECGVMCVMVWVCWGRFFSCSSRARPNWGGTSVLRE